MTRATADPPSASSAELLELAGLHLPRVLASPSCQFSMARIAQSFPLAAVGILIFETHLSEVEPVLDLSLCFLGLAESARMLPDRLDTRIRQLFHDFAELGTCDHAWLEYDNRGPEMPSFFLGRTNTEPKQCLSMLGPIEQARGHPLPRAVRSQLSVCVDAVPEGATIPQFGILMSRGETRFRLCIDEITSQQIAEYLRALGWHGSISHLERMLKSVMGLCSNRMLLDLDVGHQLEQGIGVELFASRTAATFDWRPLIDQLVRLGLAHAPKAEAILTWPGSEKGSLPGDPGPRQLVRKISHVKMVFEPNRQAKTKAYLLFRRAV